MKVSATLTFVTLVVAGFVPTESTKGGNTTTTTMKTIAKKKITTSPFPMTTTTSSSDVSGKPKTSSHAVVSPSSSSSKKKKVVRSTNQQNNTATTIVEKNNKKYHKEGNRRGTQECTVLKLTMLTDTWPEEIGITLAGNSGETIWEEQNTLAGETLYEWETCLLTTDCFTLAISDIFGDGLADNGYVSIQWNDEVVYQGSDYTQGLLARFGDVCFDGSIPTSAPVSVPEPTTVPTPAPQQPVPTNAPQAAPTPIPSSNSGGGSNGNDCTILSVVFTTDRWPEETSIWLGNDDETLWDESAMSPQTVYEFEACLAESSCYTLNVADSFGDGLVEDGSVSVIWDGVVIFNNAAFGFGYSASLGGGCSGDTNPTPAPQLAPTAAPQPAPTPAPTPNGNSGSCVTLSVSLRTDRWPEETSIWLGNNDETLWEESALSPQTVYEFEACLAESSCYTLNVADSFGDGLVEDGSVSVIWDGVVIFNNAAFGFGYSASLGGGCSGDTNPTPAPQLAPTVAPQPAPTPAPTPNGNSGSCVTLSVSLRTDRWPEETSIWLGNNDETLWEESAMSPQTVYEFEACLVGCYTLNVSDSFGDGLVEDGYVTVTWDGSLVFNDPTFGFGYSSAFGTECSGSYPSPTPDPTATPPNGGTDSCSTLSVTLKTDRWPEETSIWLGNDDETLWEENDMSPQTLYELEACLDNTMCYTLNVADSFGDGLVEDGYVTVIWEGETVWTMADFGFGYTNQFGGGC